MTIKNLLRALASMRRPINVGCSAGKGSAMAYFAASGADASVAHVLSAP